LKDVLHFLGTYCASCSKRGSCNVFCEKCFAKKPVNVKGSAAISQMVDLNLVQHKIVLNGERTGLEKPEGVSSFY
jgi:hypothetical protein